MGGLARGVGTVEELWRYPVKSMRGERRPELLVLPRGALGDRAWALRELGSGRIASAKRHPRLLGFRATYDVEPTLERPGRVIVHTPNGDAVAADDPEASAVISRMLDHPMRLENRAGARERTGIDRATVFGDVPVSDLKPDWTPATMPDYFELMGGSFFEIGPVYVLASGSVDHLRTLQGGTALIDRRRFRPNIYIDSRPEGGGFVEDGWLQGALALGEEVALHKLQPTLWCVTSTLAQEELPRDLSVLRTTAKHHGGCLGVYAAVSSPGVIRVGDPVVLDLS
jgi:MOSC domain-containing protein